MNDGLLDGFGPFRVARRGDLILGGARGLETDRLPVGANDTVPIASSTAAQGYISDYPGLAHMTSAIGGTENGLPGVVYISQQTNKPTASRLHYQWFLVDRPIVVSEAVLDVSVVGTAGAKVSSGIFRSDGSRNIGALVYDLGEYDVSAGTGNVAKTGLSISLPRGIYAISLHTDASATQATFNGYRGALCNGDAALGKTNRQFIYQRYVARAYSATQSNPGIAWTNFSTSTSSFIYYHMLSWTTL
jgi:hypothetical protein